MITAEILRIVDMHGVNILFIDPVKPICKAFITGSGAICFVDSFAVRKERSIFMPGFVNMRGRFFHNYSKIYGV
jgi:hypothetical protein